MTKLPLQLTDVVISITFQHSLLSSFFLPDVARFPGTYDIAHRLAFPVSLDETRCSRGRYSTLQRATPGNVKCPLNLVLFPIMETHSLSVSVSASLSLPSLCLCARTFRGKFDSYLQKRETNKTISSETF